MVEIQNGEEPRTTVSDENDANNVKITGTLTFEIPEVYDTSEILNTIVIEIGETSTNIICKPMNVLAHSKPQWSGGRGTYEIEFKIEEKTEVVVSVVECACMSVTVEPDKEYTVNLEVPGACLR